MAETVDEGILRFEFGDNWQITKYDNHPDYRAKIQKLQHSKAVDIVGIYQSKDLYFIEITDYRGHEADRQRLTNNSLSNEVAWKVRDSIAGLIGAHRTCDDPHRWKPFLKILTDRDETVRVILWLEEEILYDYDTRKMKQRTSVLTKIIKQRLNWLTSEVLVCSSRISDSTPPDLEVTELVS